MPGPVNILRYGLGSYFYDKTGHNQAKALFSQAYKGCKQHFAPSHVGNMWCVHMVAECLLEQGSYAAAEPLYRADLAIRDKYWEFDAPTLGVHSNLCYCMYQQGKPEALSSLMDAFRIACKSNLQHSPDGRNVAWMLAQCLIDKGQAAKVVSVCQRALVRHEHVVVGKDQAAVYNCFLNLARACQSLKKYDLGAAMAQEALRLGQVAHQQQSELHSVRALLNKCQAQAGPSRGGG